MSPARVLVLGKLRLDREAGALSCAGDPVELRPKGVELLCVLAEAQGALVTKDELLDRLWPGQLVEENNLQVQVSGLRKVLERHAAGELHLMTVPGKGYKLLGATVAGQGGGAPPLPRARGPVLAVLPFDTFGEQDIALIAQWTAEEISVAISRVRWLAVIGSGSVAAALAAEPDLRALARGFEADYLVQGSLRRDGPRLRMTVRLCEAGQLTQLWSQRYECEAQDLFALQDEIAGKVVSAIEPGVEQAELARIRRQAPANLQAWEHALRAAILLRPLMPEGARQALRELRAALGQDPHYGWAMALKAWCHHVIYSRGGLAPAEREDAVEAARAAIALGSDDALVLATSGLVLWFEAHDLHAAFDLFDRALAVSPSSYLALAASAVALGWSGQPALAAERAQRALRLNPFHPLRYLAWLGLASSRLQQEDAAGAVQAAAQAVESNPGFSVPLAYLCAAQARTGDLDAARLSARRLLAAQPLFSVSRFGSVVGVNPAVFDHFAQGWLAAGVPP